METSDIIALVAAVLALGSVAVAGWALKYARRSATAGEKSADAADIAAQEAKRSADAAEESNRIAARALALAEPALVAWKVEPIQYGAYDLRNIGTQTATGVTVDLSRINTVWRTLPDNATIAAGDAARFMLMNPPSTLFLTWDGQAEPFAVPMPPVPRPTRINTRRN